MNENHNDERLRIQLLDLVAQVVFIDIMEVSGNVGDKKNNNIG